MSTFRPEVIFHLAARTFVPDARRNPGETLGVNVMGAVNVLEAAVAMAAPPRVILVSSAEVYGIVAEDDLPVGEETPLAPANPYAASKAAMEMAARSYESIESIVVRPFNHTGPGQSPLFVCSDFAQQVAQIEAGAREAVIHVGNLDAERDFCDVRDVVRAYRDLAVGGTAGAVYNVASGRSRSIRSMLDALVDLSHVEVRVEVEENRLRPSDLPRIAGDASRLRNDVGWEPRIPFETTLSDLLDGWRAMVAVEVQP